jgi:dihydrofolate synthase/folylpolyglutamate synthase
MGMVKDKAVQKVLALLPKNALYYFTKAQIPRAISEHELYTMGSAYDLKGNPYPDVNTAVKVAISNALKDDLVLICGSVFIAGEVEDRSLHHA